jgi:hypothetical protein
MVKCPKCGFDSQEGKFCIACGQPLNNTDTQSNLNQEDVDYKNNDIQFGSPQNESNNQNEFRRPENTQQLQNNLHEDNLKNNDMPQNTNVYNPLENTPANKQDNTPIQNNPQSSTPMQQNTQIQKPYDNPGYNQNPNIPAKQKSKLVGFLLNFFVPGLGYGYVDKWKEGVMIFVAYFVLSFLGLILLIILIGAIFLLAAFILWIYSLIKTMDMIDKYNNGLPY